MRGSVRRAANGLKVFLNGDLSTAITIDSSLKFSFNDVETPYDLTVVGEDYETNFITEFRGLTRSNPVLTLDGRFEFSQGTRLEGTLSGSVFPLASGQSLLFGLEGAPSSTTTAPRVAGSFFHYVDWPGLSSTYSGSLVAVIVEGEDTGEFNYKVAAKVGPIELEAGETETGIVVSLTEPVSVRATTLEGSKGAFMRNVSLGIETFNLHGAAMEGRLISVPDSSMLGVSKDFRLPEEGGTLSLEGWDGKGGSAKLSARAVLDGTTTLNLPDTISLRAMGPASGATDVDTRPTLMWTAVPETTSYLVTLGREEDVLFFFVLPPTTTSFRLPDYAAVGGVLRAGTTYVWGVSAYVGQDLSADVLTNGSGRGQAAIGNGGLRLSRGVEFTTAAP